MSLTTRLFFAMAAACLAAIATLMPATWYELISLSAAAQQFPLNGINLFQTALAIEALLLIFFALAGWKYSQSTPRTCRQTITDTEHTGYYMAAGLITLLAVLLRFHGISQSLWIDEIATLQYTRSTLFEQFTIFTSPNDHWLNTLLIKISILLFGETEWSTRLPAVLFGIATVPVFFFLTKNTLPYRIAIATSLLLAVSYHHIFFSQNARGYSAHLFLSLAATWYFLLGLHHDRKSSWLMYIIIMLMNFAVLMNTVFVFLSHILSGIVVILQCHHRQDDTKALLRRLFFVFAILGVLVFHFYSVRIPQIVTTLNQLYSGQATGFSFFSAEFLNELVRGLSAGLGNKLSITTILAAMPVLLVGLIGMIRFFRIHFLLALLLLLPGLLTGLYLLIKGLSVSPRFFLFEIFFMLICATLGIDTITKWLQHKLDRSKQFSSGVFTTIIVLLLAGSVAILPRYYNIPKQAYREAVEYIESRRSADSNILVISTAGTGISYYHGEDQFADNTDYDYQRDQEIILDKLNNARQDDVAVTTFHRALRIRMPEVIKTLRASWQPYKSFPATIGDGSITLWIKKPAP